MDFMLPQVTDKRLTLRRKSQRDTSGSEVDGSGMQFLRGGRPAPAQSARLRKSQLDLCLKP
jgi:hypothetical protein